METRLMARPSEGANWRREFLDDALNGATEKQDASLSTRIREVNKAELKYNVAVTATVTSHNGVWRGQP
jgi:hypothetical protein